eukprot:6200711-Pleurochrysis_carterae.AAC.2
MHRLALGRRLYSDAYNDILLANPDLHDFLETQTSNTYRRDAAADRAAATTRKRNRQNVLGGLVARNQNKLFSKASSAARSQRQAQRSCSCARIGPLP